MDSQESNRREVAQLYGLVREDDISKFDQPLGSFTEFINLNGSVPGEIRTRKGVEPATDFTGTPSSQDILSLCAYNSPLGETVVTHDSNGDVKARRANSSITLATGMSGARPLRFAVTRDNQLVFVNGLQRGKIWPGANASALNLGVDPPTAVLTSTLGSGGGLSEGTYLVAYRYVDRETLRTDYAYSEMSAVQSYDATDTQKFTHDLTTVDNPAGRCTHIEVWRTTVNESSVFYFVGVQAESAATTMEDTFTDQDLIDAAAEDPDKVISLRGRYGVVMRRFTPPPKTKAAVVIWKDRAWYGVDAVYDTGTVSITSGDATLTGAGTAFSADFVDRYVYIDGAVRPYKILSYTSATSVELTPTPAESLSGKAYQIKPDPAERNQIYYSAIDEPESVHPTFAITVQSIPEDTGEITAMMPLGGNLVIFKNDHAYRFNFSKEPNYDGSCQHAFARGCLNQASWSTLDGVAYVMDRDGAYAVAPGGGVEPISDVIQSLWRDGTIDFDEAEWFFVHANSSDRMVRFFVKFDGEFAGRPSRALCYHTLHKTWSQELYQNKWSNAVRLEVDGAPKTLIGGHYDRLYYLGSGELDGTLTEHSGTVTSATDTTLTDSGASFGSTNSLLGASVAICAGTGFGQERLITGNTGTQLTIPVAWYTNPDSTSRYVVGGIVYKARMAAQQIVDQAKKEQELTSVHLTVQPIEADLPMHVREIWDFDDDPTSYVSTGNSPDRLVSWEAGSADKVVAIHLDARVNDAGTGKNRGKVTLFDYSKSAGSRLQGRTHVAIEIEGVKGDEQIRIHRLGISGTGK